jgi:chromosome segregation ATPase
VTLRFIIDLIGVRRTKRAEPADIGNVVAQGAEKAVLSLGKALESAERRIMELQEDYDECQAALSSKTSEVAIHTAELSKVHDEVRRLRAQVRRLADLIPPERRPREQARDIT